MKIDNSRPAARYDNGPDTIGRTILGGIATAVCAVVIMFGVLIALAGVSRAAVTPPRHHIPRGSLACLGFYAPNGLRHLCNVNRGNLATSSNGEIPHHWHYVGRVSDSTGTAHGCWALDGTPPRGLTSGVTLYRCDGHDFTSESSYQNG